MNLASGLWISSESWLAAYHFPEFWLAAHKFAQNAGRQNGAGHLAHGGESQRGAAEIDAC